MKLAIVPVLLGVLSGTAFAAEVEAPAPKGYVTIQEVPLVMVEAKRWNTADEQAFQQAQAKLMSKAADRRDIAYVAR